MKSFWRRMRTTLPGMVVIAVLSVAAVAVADRAIPYNSITTRDIRDNQVNTRDLRDNSVSSRDLRDNSITTRDIRDNQVNTRDLRDGSVRGIDVRDGSLEFADLSAAAVRSAESSALFDPRAHGASECCLSWARGPLVPGAVVPVSANPLPGADSGVEWRSAVLEAGTYLVQTSGESRGAEPGAAGAATRLFLGGKPVGDAGGYAFFPVADGPLPARTSSMTVIEVGTGDPAQRRLVQRAAALGANASLSDNLLVWRVTPR